MDVLLNNKPIRLNDSDFPILVTGKEGSGSSMFTVCLAVNLLNRGRKIIFFSAYPMAKQELRKNISKDAEKRAIIIDSGQEKVFLKTISNINDLPERVMIVKNIDNYSKKILPPLINARFVIYSGDIDKCSFADELIKTQFSTKIYFSRPKIDTSINVPQLEKYQGYFHSGNKKGIVSLNYSL